MKKGLSALFASIVLLAAVSCADGGKIIPRGTFAKIYADMLVADQWLNDHYDERRVADTCLFYEPIFAKYGYTSEDYRASVKHYIRKPEDYKKIIEQATVDIMKDIDQIKDEAGMNKKLQEVQGSDESGELEGEE